MKKMNNKGFTLMELLATIVVLGLVTTFTIVTMVNLFDEGKDKAEEAFAKQIEGYIEDYIALYSKNISFISEQQTAFKCHPDESDPDRDTCESVAVQKSEDNDFQNIIDIIVGKDLKNPKTEQVCSGTGSNLTIYKDEDFVYCFRLKDLDCLSNEINTCYGIYKNSSGEENVVLD